MAWIDEEQVIDAFIGNRNVALRPGEIELSKPFGSPRTPPARSSAKSNTGRYSGCRGLLPCPAAFSACAMVASGRSRVRGASFKGIAP